MIFGRARSVGRTFAAATARGAAGAGAAIGVIAAGACASGTCVTGSWAGGSGSLGLSVNTAVAVRSEVMTSVHEAAAVPLQAPLQPVNAEPGAAMAVSVTVVP